MADYGNYGEFKLWKDMIIRQCQRQGSAAVTVQDLEKALCGQVKKPSCIRNIFEEMLQAGEIKTREDFLKPPEPPQHNTLKEWTWNLMVKSVKIVKNSLLQSVEPNFSEIPFIVQEVVVDQADKLQKLLENEILSKTEVIKRAGEELKMSPDGVSLVLHVLLSEQRVVIRSDLLKFAAPEEKIHEISDIEYSIGQMELMKEKLTHLIVSLDEEMKQNEEQAREYARQSNRTLARLYMMKRNLLRRKLYKRINTLANIDDMMARIDDATVNQEIMQAYMEGGKSLKDAMEKTGITMEMVEQTMQEVREPYMLSNDVETALGTDFSATDTAEMEKELQDIMEEEQENEALNMRFRDLHVPDHSPSSKRSDKVKTSV